jgi:hypothetical protein
MQTVSWRKGPILETLAISVLPDFLVFRHSLRCCKLLNYLIIADSHRRSRRFESLPVEQKRWKGCAPSFSAHVRWGEHGAPVQNRRLWFGDEIRGFRLQSNLDKPEVQASLRDSTADSKAPLLFLPCSFVVFRSSLLVRQLRHRHPLVPWSGTGSAWGRSEHQQSCPGLQDMGALHCEQNAFMVGAF